MSKSKGTTFVPNQNLDRQQLERIVDDHLSRARYMCSREYRLGMIDMLCRRAFGTSIPTPFKRCTAAADAHWAGVEHGYAVWEEIAAVQRTIENLIIEIQIEQSVAFWEFIFVRNSEVYPRAVPAADLDRLQVLSTDLVDDVLSRYSKARLDGRLNSRDLLRCHERLSRFLCGFARKVWPTTDLNSLLQQA